MYKSHATSIRQDPTMNDPGLMMNNQIYSRKAVDVQEVENLARMYYNLKTSLDSNVQNAFQKLLALTGSKDFLPAAASVHEYLQEVLEKKQRYCNGSCQLTEGEIKKLAKDVFGLADYNSVFARTRRCAGEYTIPQYLIMEIDNAAAKSEKDFLVRESVPQNDTEAPTHEKQRQASADNVTNCQPEPSEVSSSSTANSFPLTSSTISTSRTEQTQDNMINPSHFGSILLGHHGPKQSMFHYWTHSQGYQAYTETTYPVTKAANPSTKSPCCQVDTSVFASMGLVTSRRRTGAGVNESVTATTSSRMQMNSQTLRPTPFSRSYQSHPMKYQPQFRSYSQLPATGRISSQQQAVTAAHWPPSLPKDSPMSPTGPVTPSRTFNHSNTPTPQIADTSPVRVLQPAASSPNAPLPPSEATSPAVSLPPVSLPTPKKTKNTSSEDKPPRKRKKKQVADQIGEDGSILKTLEQSTDQATSSPTKPKKKKPVAPKPATPIQVSPKVVAPKVVAPKSEDPLKVEVGDGTIHDSGEAAKAAEK